MGCDIHLRVEYKRTVKGVEKWVCGDYFKIEPHEDDGPAYDLIEVWRGRDYAMFTTLANVRNYAAAVNEPICDPKGMPDDCCKETLEHYKRWEADLHSASHFTLAELNAFQATNPVFNYTGMISPEQSEALDNGIYPDLWCQGTSDKSWVRRNWTVPNTTLEHLIQSLQRRGYELFNRYRALTPEEETKIRIVFWFDN